MVIHSVSNLKLPLAMKVHVLFNVALLKRYHGKYLLLNLTLADDDAEYEVE